MTLLMGAAEGGQEAPSSSGALSGGGAVSSEPEGGRVYSRRYFVLALVGVCELW